MTTAHWPTLTPTVYREATDFAPSKFRQQGQAVKELRALLGDATTAMVTTRDEAGQLHARVMEATARGFDGVLWFVTSVLSSVVSDLRDTSEIQVTYLDELSSRCLVLNGIGSIVRGTEVAQEQWHGGLSEWFPRGPSDPGMAFLRVDVMSVDVWE